MISFSDVPDIRIFFLRWRAFSERKEIYLTIRDKWQNIIEINHAVEICIEYLIVAEDIWTKIVA